MVVDHEGGNRKVNYHYDLEMGLKSGRSTWTNLSKKSEPEHVYIK